MREFWFDLASRIAADAHAPADRLFRSLSPAPRATMTSVVARERAPAPWYRRLAR